MNHATSIYALHDPHTSELRYIGKTVQLPARRLNNHVSSARKGRSYVCNWIRSLKADPVMRVLAIVENEQGSDSERRAIAHYRSLGFRLTNLTDGGEGLLGYRHGDETRARISAANTGRVRSAESRRKMSLAQIGRKRDPEVVARIAAHKNGTGKRSTESRARMSAAGRARQPPSAETRAKLSACLMGNQHAAGNVLGTATRAKIAAAVKGRKHSPESIMRMQVAQQKIRRQGKRSLSAEHKSNISIALQGKQNALGVKHTLEVRSRMRAAQVGRPSQRGRVLSPQARENMREGHRLAKLRK